MFCPSVTGHRLGGRLRTVPSRGPTPREFVSRGLVAYLIDVEQRKTEHGSGFRVRARALAHCWVLRGRRVPCTFFWGVWGMIVFLWAVITASLAVVGVCGGGLRVWLSSAEWTRASFFLISTVHGPFLWSGLCVVCGLLDDCVTGVGVLVKLSRAHGGCLGIRSR